jgi:hypothetical protein
VTLPQLAVGGQRPTAANGDMADRFRDRLALDISTPLLARASLAWVSPADTDTALSIPQGPDYRIDHWIDREHYTGLKCGTPAGDWHISMQGVRNAGSATIVLSGTAVATLAFNNGWRGTWTAQHTASVQGIPVSRGGQDGTTTGRAELTSVELRLLGETESGTFYSQNPYAALSGSTYGGARTVILPIQSGRFC